MQNVMEMADFALVTVFTLSFALLLQWVALEGFFRFLLAQSPVQGHAGNAVSGLSPKHGIVQPVPRKAQPGL